MFQSVRADIIAEHFTKEHNASVLVIVAKELDDCAHSVDATKIQTLSIDAKSTLGAFADFTQVKRSALFDGKAHEAMEARSVTTEKGTGSDELQEQSTDPNQSKLL